MRAVFFSEHWDTYRTLATRSRRGRTTPALVLVLALVVLNALVSGEISLIGIAVLVAVALSLPALTLIGVGTRRQRGKDADSLISNAVAASIVMPHSRWRRSIVAWVLIGALAGALSFLVFQPSARAILFGVSLAVVLIVVTPLWAWRALFGPRSLDSIALSVFVRRHLDQLSPPEH